MSVIKESDLLRLSMILENQGETTRNKYICKLTECVLYDSKKEGLSAIEVYEEILGRFQLQFDILEIENAINLKGRGRIIKSAKRYHLNPNVANKLANSVSPEDKLKEYIALYTKEKPIPKEINLLKLLERYLYYSFNSNARNFSTIIGADPKVIVDDAGITEFKPSATEIDIINDFIAWNNVEKNKLFYSIISSCYEYCLITAKKSPVISKKVFRGKRFFIDTNIVFRMAGFNKDDRRFVVNTFIEKCKEVGISLCYTSAVFDEIFRVIESQVNYICKMGRGQAPVNYEMIDRLSDEYEVNDFYIKYYNWCKEPQNNYRDYTSFKKYLEKLIYKELEKLEYVDSSKVKTRNDDRYVQLFSSLKEFKEEKRLDRSPTEESIETDIKQILFLENLRPKCAKSLWEMNDYLVSADQLLVSWADSLFDGIPMVVIPSIWLSIILKISGRASNDDYKSFCMFLTLRHHHNNEEKIEINPVELLSRLSEKTIDSGLKEQIIEELTTNKCIYTFESEEDYEINIERAFDKVLEENAIEQKQELKKAVEEERKIALEAKEEYRKELKVRKTNVEYAKEYASKKAVKKTEWYAQRDNVLLAIKGVFFVSIVIICVYSAFNFSFVIHLLFDMIKSDEISEKAWSVLAWVGNLFVISFPAYLDKVWSYLGSEKRRNKLCDKYFKQQIKVLDHE